MAEEFSVTIHDQMPDTRVTIHEAAQAALVGYFSEGTLYSLLPEGVTPTEATGWEKRLIEHVEQDGRGGLDALAIHHLLVNLPREATEHEQHQLVRHYANEMFADQGLLAQYVLHSPHDFDPSHPLTPERMKDHQLVVEGETEDTGERMLLSVPGERYFHAHIAVPVYPMLPDANFADTPHRGWDDPALFLQWRREWTEDWEQFRQEKLNDPECVPEAPLNEVWREEALRALAARQELQGQEALMREVVAAVLPTPDAAWEVNAASDIALLRADEISRIEEFALEGDHERGFEIGMGDE